MFLSHNAQHVQLRSCPLHLAMWTLGLKESGAKADTLSIPIAVSNILGPRHLLTSASIHETVQVYLFNLQVW